MRRRFGNRRRLGWRNRRDGTIDAVRWFRKIAEDATLPLPELEPVDVPDLPGNFAVAGKGTDAEGRPVRVAFSPTSGGDAWLAAVVVGLDVAASGDSGGEVIAVAPTWNAASRQRLSLGSALDFPIRALEASSLRAPGAGLEPESASPPVRIDLEPIAAQCRQSGDRALFVRTGEALRGLAAKHGGVARGSAGGFELVLQGRRIAELKIGGSGIVLETLLPQRASARIEADRLADAMDQLEGAIRKRLNDRRTRNGEEGLRARAVPLLVDVLGLKAWSAWPLPGQDPAVVDVLGVNAEGIPFAATCREHIGLPEFGALLDTLEVLRANLPVLLPAHAEGVRLERPRLGLAAGKVSGIVGRVAAVLGIETALYEVRSRRGRGLSLSALEVETLPTASRPRREEARTVERTSSADPTESTVKAPAESPGAGEGSRGRSRRRRGGRGRGSRRGEAAETESADAEDASTAAPEESRDGGASAGFDELSFFDLDEEPREGTGSRRRGGRGRQRGPRGAGGTTESSEEPKAVTAADSDAARDSVDSLELDPDVDADADVDQMLAPLPDEVSDVEEEKPAYEDDEEGPTEESTEAPAEEAAAPVRPRKRSAILAHADRNSIIAAVLLARDIRMVEGIWVYPQAELMTFFRSVATDLREDTPIYVIGFTPSPSREVLQAATLYSNRLTWFDHRDWPPEDALALRQTIGKDALHLAPGVETCLPSILEGSIRRSRFSDKLVDLAAGRFTDHDYEKWGRLWWHRLAEFTERDGDRRADLEPLLAGRPSDLAKEAARVEAPPPPPEVAYVAERDFRLVHFSNHSLVVIDAPESLDCHLLGRIARERYGASLSMVRSADGGCWVLTGEELPGRRSLDVSALVDHLAAKLKWVEALAGEDRVARFRIEHLASQPHRLEEVIGLIAMARSILER